MCLDKLKDTIRDTYQNVFGAGLVQIDPPSRTVLCGVNSVLPLVDEVQRHVVLGSEVSAAKWCKQNLFYKM